MERITIFVAILGIFAVLQPKTEAKKKEKYQCVNTCDDCARHCLEIFDTKSHCRKPKGSKRIELCSCIPAGTIPLCNTAVDRRAYGNLPVVTILIGLLVVSRTFS